MAEPLTEEQIADMERWLAEVAPVSVVYSRRQAIGRVLAEVRRLREQNGALKERLLGAATVLPDLVWKHERNVRKRRRRR